MENRGGWWTGYDCDCDYQGNCYTVHLAIIERLSSDGWGRERETDWVERDCSIG